MMAMLKVVFTAVLIVVLAKCGHASEDDLAKLQTVVEQQAKAIQNLQAQMTLSINQLGTLLQDINSVKTLTASLQTKQAQQVAFSVRFTDDPISVGQHSVLKFNNIISSRGDGYDHNTGRFTAPVAGLYVFFAHIMHEGESGVEVSFIKDDTVQEVIHADADSNNDQGTMLFPLHLNKGDIVYLKQNWGSSTIRGSYWSGFSGYLADED